MAPPAQGGALQAIIYSRGSLSLLDQRLLPFEKVYLPVATPQAAWAHIRDMVVRGAPAIGVTCALSLAVDLVANKAAGEAFASTPDALAYINETLDYLVTSRPTAVNLADAAVKMRAVAEAQAAAGKSPSELVAAVVEACEAFFEEDVRTNKAIGAYGADALVAAAKARGRGGKLRVLTHCNTGSLATAGFGTALGVIRELQARGLLEHAYCTETRPYNQGARLTAFELAHDGLPATLICDSAAAALMGSGRVDAVVVGADRVVSNGDTANKIGTYSLSIVAAHHDVPFFVAAPTTTLDANLPDGSHIVIEQRTPEEVTHFKGARVAAEGVGVWNPAFDVAPGPLIEAIITERGLVPRAASPAAPSASTDGANGHHAGAGATSQRPPFAVREFMRDLGLWGSKDAGAAAGGSGATGTSLPTAPGFRALDEASVKHYIADQPELAAVVGPVESIDSWTSKEVGDGNINFVYIVTGPSGSLCVKQALPFVRCVGESWPMTQDRVRIEAEVLQEEYALCPQHVPRVYRYDAQLSLIAMQYLAPPLAIIRHGLVAGRVYPLLAEHVAHFLAATLFSTSLLALDSTTFRERAARFSNNEMCRLTEQVIFTEPYTVASNNRHTTPQLDSVVAALRADAEAKAAAAALKAKFVGQAEALLHGDLHTGSIMASETETYVIDPEFAYYGPMGFDVGKIIANLLLAFFSTDGHEAASGVPGSRAAQREWLLSAVSGVWEGFRSRFVALWDAHAAAKGPGELYHATVFGPDAPEESRATLPACQAAFLQRLFGEAVSFAGSFIIRRIVGIAHVADLESIADPDLRAGCERRALGLGRALLVGGLRGQFADIATVATAAEEARTA